MSSSICQNIEVIFHWQKHRGCLKLSKVDVIFHVPKTLRLPFICPHIQDVFHLPRYWSRLPFVKFWSRLPFSKLLWSSSIFQNIEVVLELPSAQVQLNLPTWAELDKNDEEKDKRKNVYLCKELTKNLTLILDFFLYVTSKSTTNLELKIWNILGLIFF